VQGQVRDDDDGESGVYSKDVTVNNVAPTATFSNNGPVDEGSSFTLTMSDGDDVSSADKAAKFEFAFDCGDGFGYGAWSSPAALSASQSCSTSDNGNRSVKAKVRDKDGGEREYTASVLVKNVAPSATFNAPDEVNEGSNINISLTGVQDPGADTHEFRFSCANGATWSAYGNSNSFSCPTTDNGTRTVKGQVRDDDGGESALYSKAVTVQNVAPSATFNAPDEVNEGSSINLSLTGVVDPGSADTHQFHFSCDGGASWSAYGSGNSFSCPTTDNGTRTVQGQVRDDDDGESAVYSKDVTVKNVAPTATFSNNGPVDEGSSFTLTMSNGDDVSSADKAAKFEFAFDCGSGYGAWSSPAALSASQSCSTNDNGSRSVKAKVRDKDAGVSEYSGSVLVRNVAPTATFNAPSSVSEGQSINVSLTSPSDPSSVDTSTGFTYVFDCGTGSGYGAYSSMSSASCPTNDNGSRTVKGKIRDKDGGETEYTKTVTVTNAAPVVNVTSPSFGALYAKPATLAMNVTFTDAGTADTHSCSFSWDDGSSSAGTVAEANGSGTCTASHTYTAAGVYTMKITVADDDGASTTVDWMVVVYDPSAGFVTGGGWIEVAPGSYPADSTLSGRANFGFNSKYKNGASVPTGETEFNFQVADFKFHSSQYDFLVVSGYKAQYKGTGEVNGVPGYSFRLTAYDGDLTNPKGPDKFRIKIMAPSGGVIFDNRVGKSDDLDLADPQQIAGGSIVVHKA
jgi:PKD domain-containing protein